MPHKDSNDVSLQDIVDKFSIPIDLAKKVSKEALHKLYSGSQRIFTVDELGISDLEIREKAAILGHLPVTLKGGLDSLDDIINKDVRDSVDSDSGIQWKFKKEANELVGKMRYWLEQNNPWNVDLTRWFETRAATGGGVVSILPKGPASSVTQFGSLPLIVTGSFSQLKNWVGRVMNVLKKPTSFVDKAYTRASDDEILGSREAAKLDDLRSLKKWWNENGVDFSIPQKLKNKLKSGLGSNGNFDFNPFSSISNNIKGFLVGVKDTAVLPMATGINWLGGLFGPTGTNSSSSSGGGFSTSIQERMPGDSSGGSKKGVGLLTLFIGSVISSFVFGVQTVISTFTGLFQTGVEWTTEFIDRLYVLVFDRFSIEFAFFDAADSISGLDPLVQFPFSIVVAGATILVALYLVRKYFF